MYITNTLASRVISAVEFLIESFVVTWSNQIT